MNPTERNVAAKRKAREAYRAALLGLKIVSASKTRRLVGDIVISLARGDYRSQEPTSSQGLYEFTSEQLGKLSSAIASTDSAIVNQQQKIIRFRQVAGKDYGSAVTAMSAFDSLQALANGQADATMCCICLDALGVTKTRDGGDDDDEAANSASISMTKCGVSREHLNCRAFLVSPAQLR